MVAAVTDTIQFFYRGPKASQINSNDLTSAIDTLRKDLATLKIPLPAKPNISIVKEGVVQFFWETTKGSTIDQQLNGKLGQHVSPANRTFLEETLPGLLIERVEFRSESPAGRRRKQGIQAQYTWTARALSERITDQFAHDIGSPNSNSSLVHQPWEHSGNNTPISEGMLPSPPSSVLLAESMRPHSRTTNPPPQTSRAGAQRTSSTSLPTPFSGPPATEYGHGARVSMPANGREQHTLPPKPHTSTSRQDTPQRTNQLTAELEAVRKRLAGDLARESQIIQELGRLSVVIPPSSTNLQIPRSSSSDHTSPDELILRARLQLTEKQLEEERRKRKAAEDSLKDVQRECREPFVVPALLDAFLTISNLSSEAV